MIVHIVFLKRVKEMKMRKNVFSVSYFLIFAVCCLNGLAAGVEYDSGTSSGRSDSLVVSFSNVDDIADAWVLNTALLGSDSFQPAVRAEWRGSDAQASGDIGNKLRVGDNYIIITLFNKVYRGFSFNSSGGKYKADISVTHNGSRVYSKSLHQDFNRKELVFATFLKATKNRDGSIAVSQNLSDYEEIAMRSLVEEVLEPHLMDSTGDAKVDYGSALKKLASNPQIMGILGGKNSE